MPPLLCHIVESQDDFLTAPMAFKSVRFLDEVTVRHVEVVKESAEKNSYWMKQEEYLKIKKNCVDVIRLALDPNKELKEDFLRGLEKKTPMGARRRNENREEARQAVLDEQRYQLYYGISDPDFIANLYSTITHKCRVEANMIGIEDQLAAKDDTVLDEIIKNQDKHHFLGEKAEL